MSDLACASMEERLDRLRDDLEKFLEKPNIAGTIDEFYGYEEEYSGLWMSGEGGNLRDGVPVWDYYSLYDGSEEINKLLARHHAHFEWHDAGTVMVYLDSID